MNLGGPIEVKGSDLGNQVAERLAQRIFSGKYNPGEMLPKEIDLVDQLAVSRASVRSGLRTLTSLGMINRQAGKGTVVQEFSEWTLLDPTVTRWMVDFGNPNHDFLKQVFDFRCAVEPYISAIAALRATARDLADIEEAYLSMEQALKGKAGIDFTQADIAFHTAIYRATHNLIWAQLAHILKPAILMLIKRTNETADELSDSLGRHGHVLECIRLRQPEEAYEAAIQVMNRTGFDLGVTPTSYDTELLALMKARSLPGHQNRPHPPDGPE